MSDRRQVLQEAAKALEPFAHFATKASKFVDDRARDNGSPIMPSKDFRLRDFQRAVSALALIRASLAAGDPPETTVTEAMVDGAVNEWRSWCRAMPPTFVDNHPRDGIRQALQAALNTKEQA